MGHIPNSSQIRRASSGLEYCQEWCRLKIATGCFFEKKFCTVLSILKNAISLSSHNAGVVLIKSLEHGLSD